MLWRLNKLTFKSDATSPIIYGVSMSERVDTVIVLNVVKRTLNNCFSSWTHRQDFPVRDD